MTNNSKHQEPIARRAPGKGAWILCAFVVIAAYLLFEHRVHALPYLPYLVLLACPLMHLFMHGAHHSQHDQRQERNVRADTK